MVYSTNDTDKGMQTVHHHSIQTLMVLDQILGIFFADRSKLLVNPGTMEVPLVVARLRRNTPSFVKGQEVFVYNTSPNIKSGLMVIGRYQGEYLYRLAVCPCTTLQDFHPVRVTHTALLRRLTETFHIHRRIFLQLFGFPDAPHVLRQQIQRARRLQSQFLRLLEHRREALPETLAPWQAHYEQMLFSPHL